MLLQTAIQVLFLLLACSMFALHVLLWAATSTGQVLKGLQHHSFVGCHAHDLFEVRLELY